MDWTSGFEAAYLIADLNEPAAHIVHNVPTGATYEEATAVVENRYGGDPWRKHFILS
jgi:hypothetical protein